MGTPEFAVPTLEKLINSHNRTDNFVKLVVTQPDKPKGRGKKIINSPVKQAALKYNIPVFQPVKIKEKQNIEEIKKYNPDIIVVVAFGQILPKELIELPKYGCINVHGSLLPKYRGAAPIQWSIINGEKVTGITTMFMNTGLDTGDILLTKDIAIDEKDDYGSLYDKMSLVGADLLLETLIKLEQNDIIPKKQNDELSTYAPMITNETAHIDWTKSSFSIINLIRGLNPSPNAYTYYDSDTFFKICNAENIDKAYENVNCGTIVEIIKNKGFVVKTGDGAVLITQMQAQGGKKMNTSDYMRGHLIEINKVLA